MKEMSWMKKEKGSGYTLIRTTVMKVTGAMI